MAQANPLPSLSGIKPPLVHDTFQPRFGGILHKDYSVEIREAPINPKTVADTQRALLFQSIFRGSDPSSLRLALGPLDSNYFPAADQSALADALALTPHPVDIVIKSAGTVDVLRPLLAATGKRLMYPGAALYMGPLANSAGNSKNKEFQVDRKLFVDYTRDLEAMVMAKTGLTDRAKVNRDLEQGKVLTALEALQYGEKGLIDGIVIGHDQVIGRSELDGFYKSKKMTAPQIAEFNKNYLNVYEVPTKPLKSFVGASDKAFTQTNYKPLDKLFEAGTADDDDLMLIVDEKAKTAQVEKKNANKPVFYLRYGEEGIERITKPPVNLTISDGDSPQQILLKKVPPKLRDIQVDDTIFFTSDFDDHSGQKVSEALVALDEKKAKQDGPSNIKIQVNSPGGFIWSAQEIKSTIGSLKTPVDVIVQGMAASCGAYLLCSATGNRFATPQSRIMIHEAAMGMPKSPFTHFNLEADSLHQTTQDFIQVIAKSADRPVAEVEKDMATDAWFNPIEALFYGNKGLIDGILARPSGDKGPQTLRIITRKDVEKELLKQLKTPEKVQKYINTHLEARRKPSRNWTPEAHNETDLFANPVMTIQRLAEKAKPLEQIPQLKASLPSAKNARNLDLFVINPKPKDDED